MLSGVIRLTLTCVSCGGVCDGCAIRAMKAALPVTAASSTCRAPSALAAWRASSSGMSHMSSTPWPTICASRSPSAPRSSLIFRLRTPSAPSVTLELTIALS